MPKIDLHMHTTASDGVYRPAEVVQIALERGMEVIAITDHDSLEGVPEALEAAQGTDLKIIAGIELGVENGPRDVHVLGYDLDPQNPALKKILKDMKDYRENRAAKIIENLNAIGIPITYERVAEIAGDGIIARPHIAKAMVEVGAVKDYQEAFDKYIGNDSPYYVTRLRISPKEGIDLIHNAGGVAIIAHPCRYENPLSVVEEFVGQGADGVEVYYPDNSPELREQLLAFANNHNLIITGGCDFHRPEGDGSLKMGREDVPAEVVDHVLARASLYKH